MNNQIQHKLLNYQPEPPAQMWNKIADALDHSTENSFAQKLYHFQSAPPAAVWDAIEQQLDKTPVKETPVVSLAQRYRIPLKYTAIAASLIFVAILISLMITKRSGSNEVASVNKKSTNTHIQSDNLNNPASNETVLYSTPDAEKRKDNHLPAPQAQTKTDTEEHNKLLYATDHPATLRTSRYVMYAGHAGNEVKVSKKLYDLFACSDEKLNCKQRIEMLQQKVAASTAMSSADFTGVLDLLKSLENNQ